MVTPKHEAEELPSQEEALAEMQSLTDELERTGRQPTEREAHLIGGLLHHIAKARGEEVREDLKEGLQAQRDRVRRLFPKG